MEPNPLPQSDVASLPRPDATVGALLAPHDPTSLCPPFPFSQLLKHTGDTTRRPSEPVLARLTSAAKRERVAIGPCLAAALDSRWRSYRERLRQCQEKFSEEAVHELRVATRRLLAQFILLSCVAPSTALEKARRILKRRLAALGDLRDAQVQRLFIEEKAASFPELLLLSA